MTQMNTGGTALSNSITPAVGDAYAITNRLPTIDGTHPMSVSHVAAAEFAQPLVLAFLQ